MQPASPPAVWPEGVPPPPPPDHLKAVQRTRLGIVLLIVATLLLWIPTIEILGLVIGTVAVILILLGASAFGSLHSGLAWTSVFLFVFGFIVEFVLALNFVREVSIAVANGPGPTAGTAALNAFDGLVVGSIICVAILSVSSALILFALEDLGGRLLLLAGVVAQVVISVSIFVLFLDPLIHQAVTHAFASTPVDLTALDAADAQINGLSWLKLLNAIPAIMFAGAYAWAHDRVSRGATDRNARKTPAVTKSLRITVVVIVLVVTVAGAAAITSGGMSLTLQQPATWQPVVTLTGNSTGRTSDFTITGTSFRFDINVTGSGPGGTSFSFTITDALTGSPAGTCGSGSSGGGTAATSCGVFSRAGTYYLDVTDATGVALWSVEVEQLA